MTADSRKASNRRRKEGTADIPSADTLPPTVSNPSLLVDGTDALVRRITHLHFILSGTLDRIRGGFAALIGVSSFQYVLMQALARLPEKNEWTVGSVAREMRMTDAYVSTEIADLVARGLLDKVTNPADRRMSFLALTEKGREAISAIAPVQQSVNDTLYGHLDKDSARTYAAELEALLVQSEKACEALDELAAEHRMSALRRGRGRR